MTGPQPSPPPAGDGLSAARTRAAELGVPLSEYVRDQLRRTRGDQAWERALAEAGEVAGAGEVAKAGEAPVDPASREALWR